MRIHHSKTQRVTIALCTKNGATYLPEQLESYLNQTHQEWDLWVSDDGSNDETWEILVEFQKKHSVGREIRLVKGPEKGVAQNFLSLICRPDFPIQSVAFSDQDDVWFPNKLAVGLLNINRSKPALFGAQSIHTDAALNPIGKSAACNRPSFANAISQNIISGHTMMFNTYALNILRKAGVPQEVPFHDWWVYQLLTGAGADVYVSPQEVIFYRQHKSNFMGANQSLKGKLARIMQVFGSNYGNSIACNTKALHANLPLLQKQAQSLLNDILNYPPSIGIARLRAFANHKIAHQKKLYTPIIYLALFLGRI